VEEELRQKVKSLRIFVCILLALTSFQSVFLYLLSKGVVPSALVVVKKVYIEDHNINAVEFDNKDNEK
tara:strand:+ start:40 stop:243 length:204 start_codon:yes stop_codon:yes gene_type:complete